MDLNEIRQQIDAVDNEIVALLEERMKLVTPEREKALLSKVADSVVNPEYQEPIVASFADIMKHSRTYQAGKLEGK